MKKAVLNIMASTGITLLVLSIIATIYGGKVIFITSIFEIAFLSTLMHLGFIVTHKFDSQYPVLEIMLDLSYAMVIALISGAVFHWYRSTPIWILIIMVFIIYLVGYLIDIYRTKKEIRIINELLQQRKEKTAIRKENI